MAESTTFTNATQILEPFRGVKKVTLEEYFTSGHRTCQGCESALVMKLMVKAAGPRTIVLGSTGCMYVANTTYYTTPWVVPWMHTQLGSSGSAALGTAAGLKALMRKGKMKAEPINVIAFCGDGGGADMGVGAISATLTHKEYNSLILLYDNESYANTDIQLSGMTPFGAHTTFSPPGKAKRLIHTRWKKNMAGMMAAGHPECRYVATVCASYAVEMMNKVRRALTIGGPTFIHSLDPCPKGWDYDPMLSHELGELAIETGIFPLYEVEDGQVKDYGKTKAIVEGRPRKPVREELLKQGRGAAFGKGARDEARGGCRTGSRAAERRPRLRGGLGTDQADRVRSAGRDRRWRRPDGAPDRRHRRKAQALAPSAHRRQQVGRSRRRGVHRRQEQEGRRPHHHHHALEPLYDAAAQQSPVQLARLHAAGPHGTRRVRPVGERGDAVQDRQGVPRRGQGQAVQGAPERPVPDGRHRLRSGRPDPHDPARAGHRRHQIHLRALQGGWRGLRESRRQARRLDREQPDRMREPLEGRPRPAARRVRHGAPFGGRVEGHPDRHGGARRQRALPHAPRDLRRTEHAEGRGEIGRAHV